MSPTVTLFRPPHRHQCDGELGPPGDGELWPDQTLDPHDDIFHRLLHVPENPSRGSTDQHLLCRGRGAALNLWETLQVGDNEPERCSVHLRDLSVCFFSLSCWIINILTSEGKSAKRHQTVRQTFSCRSRLVTWSQLIYSEYFIPQFLVKNYTTHKL